jgi:hypothetical protein
MTSWKPLDNYDWGHGTVQAREILEDETDAPDWWTDAYEIRMRFGIPEFDRSAHEREVYVDCLVHEKPAKTTSSPGGTDYLKVGERGCGKTTDNLHWTTRLLEVNEERVVWRGSQSRPGWLPFRDWATVWLPENASVTAEWVRDGESTADGLGETGLEDEVRAVRYYEDPVDLVEQLEDLPAGTFNVVYPDPSFSGCEKLTRSTHRIGSTLPFTPEWETLGDGSPTPLTHWWFAFLLAAVDHRQDYSWLSIIFDEAHNLVEEGAEEDEHSTYKKVRLATDCYDDTRRARVSIYWTTHREDKMHHKIRKEVMWRVDMPDGTPNPRKNRARSIPAGFDTVPMYADIMSTRKVGRALLYNENEFVLYSWSDIPKLEEDAGRKLNVYLGEPERDDQEDVDDRNQLEYDSAMFSRLRRGDEDRLYVKDPGDGYIDVMTGQEVETLDSGRDDVEFGGIRDEGDSFVLPARQHGSDEEVPVAKIPKRELGIEPESTDDETDENGGVPADD